LNQNPVPPEEEQEQTAGGMFKTLAAGMLLFAVGSMMQGGIRKALGKGVTRMLPKKWAARATNYAREAGRISAKGAVQTRFMDAVITSHPLAETVTRGWGKFIQPFRGALGDIRRGLKSQGLKIEQTAHGPMANLKAMSNPARWKYIHQMAATPKGWKAGVGVMEEWARRYIGMSMTFYGVDRLTRGHLTKDPSDNYNPPPIWNVPALAADYAKFTVKWMPQDLLFSGATRLVSGGFLPALVGKGVGKVLEPHAASINRSIAALKKFRMPKGAVSDLMQEVRGIGRGVAAVGSYVNSGKMAPVAHKVVRSGDKFTYRPTSAAERTRAVKNNWFVMKSLFRTAFHNKKSAQSLASQSPAADVFRQINTLVNQAGDLSAARDMPFSTASVTQPIEALIRQAQVKPKGSLIAEALRWKHARIGKKNAEKFMLEAFGSQNLERLGSKQWREHLAAYMKGTKDMIKGDDPVFEMVSRAMNKVYLGGGIYRSAGRGAATMNLGRMKPLALAKTAVKFGLHIPGANKLTFGGLLKLDNLLNRKSKQFANYMLRQGEVTYAPNPISKKYMALTSNPSTMDTTQMKMAGFINGEAVFFRDGQWNVISGKGQHGWERWKGGNGIEMSLIPEQPGGDLHYHIDLISGRLEKNIEDLRDRGVVGKNPSKLKKFFMNQEIGYHGNERHPSFLKIMMDKLRMHTGRNLGGNPEIPFLSPKGNVFEKELYDEHIKKNLLGKDFRLKTRSAMGFLSHLYERTSSEAYISIFRNLDKLANASNTLIRGREFGGKKYADMLRMMTNEDSLIKYAEDYLSVNQIAVKPWYSEVRNVLADVHLNRKTALTKTYGKASTNLTGADQLRKMYLMDMLSGIDKAGTGAIESSFKQVTDDILKTGIIGADEEVFLKSMDLWSQIVGFRGASAKSERSIGQWLMKGTNVADDSPEAVTELIRFLGFEKRKDLGMLAEAMNIKGRGHFSSYRNYTHKGAEAIANVPFVVTSKDIPLLATEGESLTILQDLKKFLPTRHGGKLRLPIKDIIKERHAQTPSETVMDSIMDEVTLFNPVSGKSVAAGYMMGRLFDVLEQMPVVGPALAFNKTRYNTPGKMLWGGIGKRVLQAGAAVAGWQALDTAIDENPLFSGTMLDEGLNVAIAEQAAKVRLAGARLADITGVTKGMKYIEGLMPGSSTFIPGAFAGALLTRNRGVGSMLMGGLAGGFGNRFVSAMVPYPDFTKSYKELREEYSGRRRVPIGQGAYMFGRDPMIGGNVDRYGANWFHRIKSQYQYTPDAFGSKWEALAYKPFPIVDVNPFAFLLGDPYHYEKCVEENTLIKTAIHGLKKVKDIKKGDIIRTHDNKCKQVEEKWTSASDQMVSIQSSLSHIDSLTTSEHKYLVYQSVSCSKRKNRISYCFPKTWNRCKTCKDKQPVELKWIRADEIKLGDFLAYPIPNFINWDGDRFLSFKDEKTSSRLDAAELIPTRVYKDDGLIDLFRLFGYYCAEGHIQRGCVCFSFAYKERNTWSKDVKNIVNNIFPNVNITIKNEKEKGTSKVYISNSVLWRAFRKFGKKEHKHMLYIDMRRDEAVEFIRGVFRGDGSFTKGRNQLNIANTSLELIQQCRDILLGLNIFSSIYKREGKTRYHKTFKKNITEKDSYLLNVAGKDCILFKKLIDTNGEAFKENPSRSHFFQNGYVFSKVTKIESLTGEYNIVDLKVKDSHSFCGVGAVYHNTHYQTRPYALSSRPFDEVPLLGPFIANTVGRLIKPTRRMHSEELENMINEDTQFVNPMAGANPARGGSGASGSGIRTPSLYRSPISPYSRQQVLSEMMYRGFMEPTGLPGFLTETALGGVPFAGEDVLAEASPLTSANRTYWNLQLGDFPMGMGEAMRRVAPKERLAKSYNPLKNRIAHWLRMEEDDTYPNFSLGDPYTAVVAGEERLPGSMYESLWNVRHSFPGSASMLGKSLHEQIEHFMGVADRATLAEEDIMEEGTAIHQSVQNMLVNANMADKIEAHVYDPRADIGGYVDAILRGGVVGSGKSALEIKSVSADSMSRLTKPRFTHRSQLNNYLKQLGMWQGGILYVAREDPRMTKYFPVKYSEELEEFNMQRLHQAREIAGTLFSQGLGYHGGESYSRLDRLRILSDVAPSSKSYKTELANVRAQIRAGMINEAGLEEFKNIQKNRNVSMQQVQMYPHRFLNGGITHPDPRYQLLSQNENIKAAAEYNIFERTVGAGWEKFLSLNSPLHTKLLQYRTPIQQYQKRVLEMQDFTRWKNPVQNFLGPYAYGLRGATDPIQGGLSGAVGGFLLGGPFGAAVGGLGMAAYGGLHGIYRGVTGTQYIPKRVQEHREQMEYWDKMKYIKAHRLYEQTGEREYDQEMSETMIGIDPFASGRDVFSNMYRATPTDERPYLFAFMGETDSGNREAISKMVSPGVRRVLESRWGTSDAKARQNQRDYEKSAELANFFGDHYLPPPEWVGWGSEVDLADVQLKTMRREGLDAHRAGLGYRDQERKVRMSPYIPGPIDIRESNDETPDFSRMNRSSVQSAIRNLIRQSGLSGGVNVSVIQGAPEDIVVNLNVSRNPRENMESFMNASYGMMKVMRAL